MDEERPPDPTVEETLIPTTTNNTNIEYEDAEHFLDDEMLHQIYSQERSEMLKEKLAPLIQRLARLEYFGGLSESERAVKEIISWHLNPSEPSPKYAYEVLFPLLENNCYSELAEIGIDLLVFCT